MTPREFIKREQEIAEAQAAYPEMEIGEAYRKWKEARGEKATMLNTADPQLQKTKVVLAKLLEKPCTQAECKGTMVLESICGSCVEGRKGYKSKWTCQECLHRELSKETYAQWLEKLSGSSKESS